MSETWVVIAGLALATVAIKASGPLAVGGRELPPAIVSVVALLAPALLTALVLVETFAGEDGALSIDARTFGVLTAGGALALRAPLIVCVAVAAVAAACVRALS